MAAAAVRAGAHYLDVTAEQAAVQEVYRAHQELEWPADVAVIPAMAFYGGLPDLLATTAAVGWETVEEITVAYGVDRWWPTEGTRNTGRRNTATRLVLDGGRLVPAPSPAPLRDWMFPGPLGRQAAGRLLGGQASARGAAAPGEVFDAADFLDTLSPHHLTIRREGRRPPD